MNEAGRACRVDTPAAIPMASSDRAERDVSRPRRSPQRRRAAFGLASLALALVLVALILARGLDAFVAAALANLAVVTWSSFVLPMRGLPRIEGFYRLRRWERSRRIYRFLGVPVFRAAVRRGPLARFNRALPAAWHAADIERIELETRAAEAGHAIAFGIVLGLAVLALVRGETARAAWLVILDLPMNLYPVLLQRDHRLRLAEHVRRGDLVPEVPGRR